MGPDGLPRILEALHHVDGRAKIAQVLSEELSPVYEYDARTSSDLILTLMVYTANGGNWAATADQLFLHRNSVQYRLQRIEALSGIKVRDRSTRLLLTVAFTMADLTTLESSISAEDKNES